MLITSVSLSAANTNPDPAATTTTVSTKNTIASFFRPLSRLLLFLLEASLGVEEDVVELFLSEELTFLLLILFLSL